MILDVKPSAETLKSEVGEAITAQNSDVVNGGAIANLSVTATVPGEITGNSEVNPSRADGANTSAFSGNGSSPESEVPQNPVAQSISQVENASVSDPVIQANSIEDGGSVSQQNQEATSTILSESELAALFSTLGNEAQGDSADDEERDFLAALKEDVASTNIQAVQAQMLRVEQATGITPSVVHAIFMPVEGATSSSEYGDQLHLVFTPPTGDPVIHKVDVTRGQVYQVAENFTRYVTGVPPRSQGRQRYLQPAQLLYQWLVEPLLDGLKEDGIEHLTFSVDEGLRSLPFAALHDGQNFLVENYSVSLMPSLALTNFEYTDVKNLDVLAMGADEFVNDFPLPAVPMELEIVSNVVWEGESYLNDGFSIENLKAIRDKVPFRMVHLATHAEFKTGSPNDSFIKFGDEKLGLHELRELGLNQPPVELMVLSACKTAIGDHDAELGFAGLAVMSGVKSALGSLWYVSDQGTLGLIAEFYQQLGQQPIKSESLRQTQLAMIRGDVRFENDQLVTASDSFPLTNEVKQLGDRQLSHPYYWSGFTVIGNPW